MTTRTAETSPPIIARIAGVLLLLSIVAGGFGEAYAPSQLIVSADATATANKILASESLFRWGFAGYLVEALCDIALALTFYALLRPVGKDLALLAAFFGLVSATTFAGAELFYFFGASLMVSGVNSLKTFSPDQLNTLGLMLIKMYETGGGIFMVFYGVASTLRGYLIFRSGYLPKVLGALFILGGLGFVASSFTLVLAPAYASGWFPLPMVVAGVALTLWLLIRGVNVPKWEEKAAIHE